MTEDHDTRLRRLRMRSWRRGTKEMDLILGPFADGPMAALEPAMLDSYEQLLAENDQDLYPWITARINGRTGGPQELAPVLDLVAAHAARHLSAER
ncbi:MAG: succinate dehydrogenase assembly factor 2 [Paracoccus sp. (in: a-proteobacteria)]|uniref:FAD assembly factor SdhE n=1 Tax=Paracoccus sp. TaxID=267 RepID=UPI0026E0AC19|nr:succinate dehydrogenase assembly factor 2 [Paracoccus sp. (in: a-proteobacteria)]MDO5613695.1 succinate dehydrogenase assembly factor 2 [Paracoccus sp. (in: a-proteobacteria)]